MASAAAIDALLPQTQCRRCGYDGCGPYAEAIAAGEADINRCPPGGDATVNKLAALTGAAPKPIADECGSAWPPKVAFIREPECIGCTRCIQACPVDAIVGAAKQMHTVIADECTGCELCLPVCPVDCIDLPLAAADNGQPAWPPATDTDQRRAAQARQRFEARQARLNNQARRRRRRESAAVTEEPDTSAQKKDTIAAAVARAKAKRAERQ